MPSIGTGHLAQHTNPNARLHDRLAASVLLIAAGFAWLYLTMHLRLAASALGPICGHVGLFVLHCPACFAAAAMIAAGVAIGGVAIRQSRTLRVQKVTAAR